MGGINRLSSIDEVTASTEFAVGQGPQDFRLVVGDLLDYAQANLEFPDSQAFQTQYAAPSATGFSIALSPSPVTNNVHLILTPTGAFAAGTIVLPLATTCVDGQRVLVNTTQAVTTLTVSGNGATAVIGAPTTLAANAFFQLKFDQPTSNWYRIG